MMENLKRVMALFMSVIMIFAVSVPVNAQENSKTTESDIVFIVILPNEVPAGITPVEYNSEEEAIAYFSELVSNTETSTDANGKLKDSTEDNFTKMDAATNVTTSSYNYDILVDSEQVGMGTVSLRASYGTTGASHTGTITYINPYTQFTGFTLGIEWNQSNIDYSIYSNQKDAYIYCNGTLNYYILVSGLIKVASKNLSLNRTCYLAR